MRPFIALILCVSALFTHAIEEERWKLRAQNNGVDVSTQKVNGSSIDRFKATAIIEADYEAVKEFILDYPNYPLWYENYKSGNILKRKDNGELLVRFIINAPFPIKDRDSVNQVFIKQNEERITIRLESQPNLIAKTW